MKIKQKITATILTLIMVGAHLLTLGNAVVAAGVDLSGQNKKTNHANVEFDSYLENGSHEQTFEAGATGKVILKLKVSNTGYLKNGIVKFSNVNFEIDTENLKSDKVQSSSKDEIKLKQINNSNNEVVIEVPIKMTKAEQVAKDHFSKMTNTKLTGIYVDGNGKEKSIQKEITNNVKWQAKAELEVAGEISKYLPYQAGEEYGVLVQVKLHSGLKNNSLPIAKTRLEIGTPEIKIAKQENGETKEEVVKPNRVIVVANTKATNGENGIHFSQNNYTYNLDTNKVEIEVENTEKEGNISWNQTEKDEYLVNYIYTGKEVYDTVKQALEKAKETQKTEEEKKEGQTNENAITGEIEIGAKLETYNAEQTGIENSGKMGYTIEEIKGNISDVTIQSTTSISKGYIYANYAKAEKEAKGEEIEEKLETSYEVNYSVDVTDKEIISKLELETQLESYQKQEGKEYKEETSKAGSIYTKKVKIAEEIFKKMLGEEGNLEIFTKGGKSLGVIHKETAKDAQGNYVLDISTEKVNEVVIKTSTILTEGKLEFTVEKAINGEQSYTKEEMENFKKITLGVICKNYRQEVIKEETPSSDNGQTDNTTDQTENKQQTKEILVHENTNTFQMNLTEPVSKAEISISEEKKNLSTIVENKDVELRVVLDTSSNTNALYQNPKLEIQLPDSIEKVKLKSVDLLLEDELKIKDTKVEDRNGKKVIIITLEGTQTKYMNNGTSIQTGNQNIIAKGANIVIKADITMKKLTPSKQANINLYYTNESTNLYEKGYSTRAANSQVMGIASTQVNVVAPTGVATANIISGYDAKGSETINVTDQKQAGTIETYGEKRTVKIEGIITNNYTNSIENTFILGRLPFKDNKAIDSSDSLGSTFQMEMTSKITTSGIDSSKVKIYYSTNGEATKDLINQANSWTETPSNLAEVKSYLIVIAGEIVASTQFAFNYQVQLPANLSYNNSSYTAYKVYYDNKAPGSTMGEVETAGVIGVTTGAGPDLEIKLTSNKVENSIVRNGEYVRFFVSVKNKGTVPAENVKIVIDGNRPPEIDTDENGNPTHKDTNQYQIVDFDETISTYTDVEGNKKTINIGNIGVNETKETEYEVRIRFGNPSYEDTKDAIIENQISVVSDNMEKAMESNVYKLEGKLGKLEILNQVNTLESNAYMNGMAIDYKIQILNTNNEKPGKLNNVILTIPLPKDVTVKEANRETMEGTTKEGIEILSDKIVVTIPEIERLKIETINVQFVLGEKTENFSSKVEAKVGEEIYYSNERYISMAKIGIEGSQANLEQTYIKEGEKYSYNFTIQSTGNRQIADFVLEDTLPEEVSYLEPQWLDPSEENLPSDIDPDRGVKVSIVGKEGDAVGEIVSVQGKKVIVKIPYLDPNVTVKIKIYVEAKLPDGIEEKEVTNVAKIYARNVNEIVLNSVKHFIEYNPDKHDETPDKDGRYKITGVAWLDENQNGVKEENEQLLSGIEVMLIYKSTSSPVMDVDNGSQKVTRTDENGKYEFSNLEPNEYLVIFLYDFGKYSITEYQKQDVSQSYNSDAINMKVTLDGKERYAGVTDSLKIISSNIRNIDIGLFIAEKFDLRLDKYISKVTLTTPTMGTSVQEYDHSKLEKVEILRQNVNKSTVIVEYKIVVTNEGGVAGYARKIVDYLPEDIKFNTEINQDWYLSDNHQNVYNTSLAETLIQPGESKEIKLVLSFTITDKNIGNVVNNNAEIFEAYNVAGISDIDSTPNNQIPTEDDMSNADIMLSIVTGKIVLYTTLVVTILILLTVGVIFIKKKVLDQKK